MSEIRCKVDLGTNIEVEAPERVPVIYSAQGTVSNEIHYATLEKVGSEIWAVFDAPGIAARENGTWMTAKASIVAALRQGGVGALLDRLWITAIIVGSVKALRSPRTPRLSLR